MYSACKRLRTMQFATDVFYQRFCNVKSEPMSYKSGFLVL